MAKFAQVRAPLVSPIRSVGPAHTHEGGQGFTRDSKSDLFLLAATNMVSEDTFYESAKDRDARFVKLIWQVAEDDPEWLGRFIPYVRDTMQMRSASIVLAAEYVAAGAPNGRKVVDSAIVRADEPAEMLAYWIGRYGRKVPKAIKRGVADAVNRVYNERAALKYDGKDRVWRMGDVIEMVHPEPKAPWQSALFKYLLDVRHHPENIGPEIAALPTIVANRGLAELPVERRRAVLRDSDRLKAAGMTWEALSGWLQGPMDAEAWEAIIPSMGYMALLRNLRNFDEAGISRQRQREIAAKLEDPGEVAKSRQFPFRFFSAYLNAPSMTWGASLEEALNLSCQNIPEFTGRTLVLIDVSGSMTSRLSAKSSVELWQPGAIFAGAIHRKSGGVKLVPFGTGSAHLEFPTTTAVLKVVDGVRHVLTSGHLGWGTNGATAINQHYGGEDRIVVFTDCQWHDSGRPLPDVPIYTFNLGGYSRTAMNVGTGKRHEFGGFTDAAFRLIKILEDHRSVGWPF